LVPILEWVDKTHTSHGIIAQHPDDFIADLFDLKPLHSIGSQSNKSKINQLDALIKSRICLAPY
jgi:hypothetical protein